MSHRILIIDDEEALCSVLRSFFEEQNFLISTVTSLAEARTFFLQDVVPDFVLLDIQLKDGNGFAFLSEIRQQPKLKSIPVILMSAVKIEASDRVRGLENGADDYLVKPFDFKELLLRVNRTLNTSKRVDIPIEAAISQTLQDIFQRPKESLPPPTIPTGPSAELLPLLDDGSRQEIYLDPPKGMSIKIKNQTIALLLKPKTFFTFFKRNKENNIGFIYLVMTAVGFGLQAGFQDASFGVGLVGILAFAALFSGVTALLAWIIQWVLGLQRKPLKFMPVWRALALGFCPLALTSFLGLVYVAGAQGRLGDFTAGPLLFLPLQTSSNTLGFVLRRLDVFELWAVWISACGVAVFLPGRKIKILVWAGFLWLGVVMMVEIFRAVF